MSGLLHSSKRAHVTAEAFHVELNQAMLHTDAAFYDDRMLFSASVSGGAIR